MLPCHLFGYLKPFGTVSQNKLRYLFKSAFGIRLLHHLKYCEDCRVNVHGVLPLLTFIVKQIQTYPSVLHIRMENWRHELDLGWFVGVVVCYCNFEREYASFVWTARGTIYLAKPNQRITIWIVIIRPERKNKPLTLGCFSKSL